MSKVLKGVLVYTFIILGILVVLAMLVGGIMFLTANTKNPFSFFGYRAVYKSRVTYVNKIISTEYVAADSEINLTINSGNFNVKIIQSGPDGTENIVVKKYDNLFGVYKGDYVGAVSTKFNVVETPGSNEDDVIKTYFAEVNVADVESGLVSYGDSVINVILPTDKNFKYNVNVVSNNGDVVIDGEVKDKPEHTILLNDLNVVTNRGNFGLNKIGSLVPTDTEENFVTLKSIYFQTNGGVFNLSKIKKLSLLEETVEGTDETSVSLIEINAEKGDFTFNDIAAPMEIFGQDVRIRANIINTLENGFSFNSPKGFFSIKEIITEGDAANTIATNVINVDIEKITGETSISTTYGNINVKTLNNNSKLTSVNGNINVTEANANITAVSKFGDIKINGYKKLASLTNEKGNIDATYLGEKVDTNTLDAKNKDGKTTLKNIFAPLTLNVTGSGNAIVTFDTLSTSSSVEHKITLANGEATLQVKLDTPFRLKVKGNVRGTLGNENIAELVAASGQEVIIPIFGSNNNCLININTGNGRALFEYV